MPADPPAAVVFEHREARVGHEVAFFAPRDDGWRCEGRSVGLEEGEPFAVGYVIDLDAAWRTRRGVVRGRSRGGPYERVVEGDGAGAWTVDGAERPDLDGCLDVDLGASALTNAFPVRRVRLAVGDAAQAPAVWLRELDGRAERLEQRYARLEDGPRGERYDYASPAVGFRCVLEYDASGVVLAYPGIAARIA